MSKKDDKFLDFVHKEKELAYIEKYHAQVTIRYMGKCFEEEQKNATIFKKVYWYFRDSIMRFILHNREIKHNKEISNLTEKDKETTNLEKEVFNSLMSLSPDLHFSSTYYLSSYSPVQLYSFVL